LKKKQEQWKEDKKLFKSGQPLNDSFGKTAFSRKHSHESPLRTRNSNFREEFSSHKKPSQLQESFAANAGEKTLHSLFNNSAKFERPEPEKRLPSSRTSQKTGNFDVLSSH